MSTETYTQDDADQFGETCRRDARLRDQLADVIAEWMAAPHKPEDWQRNNADDLTADLLPYVHAAREQGRAEGDRLRGRMKEIADELEDDESIGIKPHVPLLVQAIRAALEDQP